MKKQILIRGGLRDDVKPQKTEIANALLARGVSPQGYHLTYVMVYDDEETDTNNGEQETRC
jgi:hypothetical protein